MPAKKAVPAKHPQPFPSLQALLIKAKRCFWLISIHRPTQAKSSCRITRRSKGQTIYATIIERRALPIHQTRIKNLSIIPSHILLSNTDIELTLAKDHREARLKSELDKIKDQYDFVFIDNPPALGWLTLNSFTASDKVLVVVSPGYFELDSLVQLGKTLDEVREYYNPNLELLGYLFTMSEPTINSSASLQILRQTYTEKVLKTVIPRNPDLRDAHFQKLDIFSFNSRAKAALAYDKLIREIFLPSEDSQEGLSNDYEKTAER